MIKQYIKILGGKLFKLYVILFQPFNGRNIILMYHRIGEEFSSNLYDPAMIVTPNTLEMHIREISKYFNIVPLADILDNKNKENSSCAITFDDGWRDNYDYAFPILMKYDVPATIFLTVNMIGTKKQFWFHSIWDLANKAIENNKETEFISFFKKMNSWKECCDINENSINELIDGFKGRSSFEIEQIVSNAYDVLDIAPEGTEILLSWKQVHEMEEHGISIGSHTLNHCILTRVSDDIKEHEITDSFKLLKGRDVNVSPIFCYPNGDWDSASISLVSRAGYKGAVTTRLGCNFPGNDLFQLSRIALHEEISNTPSLLWFRLLQCYFGFRSE